MAMVVQVLTLMPLRTIMNFQYRFGGTMVTATRSLREEGYRRFYAGLGPALIQGPIARFGDTAANAGILTLLSSNPFLNKMPSPLKTAFASVASALFRMILVPIGSLSPSFLSKRGTKTKSRHVEEYHASARRSWRDHPQRPRQSVWRWHAMVWCLGHRSRFLRRQLPLVCHLQLAERSHSST